MGLKQNIVIKNEYTNNARSSGSRGGTPGKYVMRYMAREDATEVLAPARMNTTPIDKSFGQPYNSATFIRYMARKNATEQLKTGNDEFLIDNPDAHGSPLLMKHRFRRSEQLSGRAFGSKGLSLSHDELQQSSDEIQEAFNNGHSVQKVILSFTEDYLRDTGVLNPEFEYGGRGSYAGNIDQLKLRKAVTKGVDNLTKTGKYIDPEWVGTLQVDTGNVHAHLALVDTEFSAHRMASDGADRGKINEREKAMLRKGIHHELEDMKDLHSFHSQVSLERQSVVTFVKDYAYSTMSKNAPTQLLMASLPKDRTEWRYGTNRTSMKRANELARGIVTNTFENAPDESGYNRAMESIHQYADESQVKNQLSDSERDDLVNNGYEKLIERSVNGLYKTLREIEPDMLHVRTPITDAQSSNDEELYSTLQSQDSNDDAFNPSSYELRVRSYNTRLEHHEVTTGEYFGYVQEFEDLDVQGVVDDSAHVMRLFYEEELRFHMGVSDKYRKFLSYNHPQDRLHVEEMTPVYESLESRFYDIVAATDETGEAFNDLRDAYKKDLRQYTFDCFDKGVATLKEWDAIVDYDRDANTVDTRFVLPVQPRTGSYNITDQHFNTVKSLDVHHLGLDYYNQLDARIDSTNATRFANVYGSRFQRAETARIYLDDTNQIFEPLDIAMQDISKMESVVNKATDEGLIEVVDLVDFELLEDRQLYTFPLDYTVDVDDDVRRAIDVNIITELEDELEARRERSILDSIDVSKDVSNVDIDTSDLHDSDLDSSSEPDLTN